MSWGSGLAYLSGVEFIVWGLPFWSISPAAPGRGRA